MPRGAAPGERRGGRQKGTPNKKTQEMLNGLGPGLLPLDHMLEILRDPKQESARRDWAAEKAAPYIHPKLQTTTLQGGDKPLTVKLIGNIGN